MLVFSSVFGLFRVVPRARLERATCGLEVRCSVQLSYRGVKYLQKFTSARMKEEMNVCLPSPCAQMHSYAIKADKRKSVTTQKLKALHPWTRSVHDRRCRRAMRGRTGLTGLSGLNLDPFAPFAGFVVRATPTAHPGNPAHPVQHHPVTRAMVQKILRVFGIPGSARAAIPNAAGDLQRGVDGNEIPRCARDERGLPRQRSSGVGSNPYPCACT